MKVKEFIKKYIKFILILLVIVLLVVAFIIFENKPKVKRLSFIDGIINRIDNNEELLLFMTDDISVCGACGDDIDIINFYEKAYDLEFITVDKSKISSKDYKKLLKRLGYTDSAVSAPAVVYVRDGNSLGVANDVVTEGNFKQFLIDFKFIPDDASENDIQISYDTFLKYYRDYEDKHLVLFYTYENSPSYEFRTKMFRLSNKYNFKYDIVYLGLAGTSSIVIPLRKELGNKFVVPMLVIVGDSKVIDYVSDNDSTKIKDFLTKNKIINK